MEFTDILSALDEAQYLADTENETYYLLDNGGNKVLVSTSRTKRILETVKPRG